MEPLHLLRQLVATSRERENAFTEVLAATLRRSSCFRRAFLHKLGIVALDDMAQIETQPLHYGAQGRPDLQMSSRQFLVLCEIKVSVQLSLDQWRRYEEILKKAAGARQKFLLAIVHDHYAVHAEIWNSHPQPIVWLWDAVFQIAAEASLGESDPVASFLLSELRDLLEEHNMRRFTFTDFSQEDFSVLHGLQGVRERIETFLQAVLVELGKVLQEGVQVTPGQFSWDTYQGIMEMYPGILFDIQGTAWKGWVGVELGTDTEPQVLLYLWDGKSRPRLDDQRRYQLGQTLQEHGLVWDNSQWSWFKYLESQLLPEKAGHHLVDAVAQEVGVIMNDILTELS